MNVTQAEAALKKHFGYDRFRPMQAEVIRSIYQQKDVLVLMPTGGGKSICYQIPAITMPGTTVVISPLISLMKDQVEGLKANGIKAEYLNSSQSSSEQHRVESGFLKGHFDLLYISPEKILSQGFLPVLKSAQINLFAIDEAHCISAWGHDFRQEYTRLRYLKKEFPSAPISAFTATADKLTRKDIIDQLQMNAPQVFVASFDRPNLSIEVRPGQKRLQQIVRFIRDRPDDPGIIYCLSRKSTEELAGKLSKHGIRAQHYHAGMPPSERASCQEDFVNDRAQVICATIAFGMGIDKSNVRWVIHYNLPKNIEGYYQEIGRAGRDGAPADTLLFYSYADVAVLEEIIRKSPSEQTDVQLAKLERMRDFAEALICRRVILLNYFGEARQDNCRNCDICQNPPQYFPGTVLAQKALSAVFRLREKVGLQMLIHILRGAGRKEIFTNGYHQIKTYGAGKDLSFPEWQYYLRQMISLGLLEIAHDAHSQLRLTEQSKQVLFDGREVQLVKFQDFKERKEKKTKTSTASKKSLLQRELFEKLRRLRRLLAQQNGLPPYMIFNDATLEAMSRSYPLNDRQLLGVQGVTEKKSRRYGVHFLEEIYEFAREHPIQFPGVTYKVTQKLFQEGLSIENIAGQRQLSPATISSHLAKLYEEGEEIDLSSFISAEELDIISGYLDVIDRPFVLKEIHQYFKKQYSFDKIKFGIAHYNRVASRS